MKFQVVVLCVVTPCSEDGGSKVLRGVDILTHKYMASESTRQPLESYSL
jgi:hypothetical protein